MFGKPVQLQPPCGDFQRANADIHPDNPFELSVEKQFPHKLSFAAAQIQHAFRTTVSQGCHDRRVSLLMQIHLAFMAHFLFG